MTSGWVAAYSVSGICPALPEVDARAGASRCKFKILSGDWSVGGGAFVTGDVD